MQDAAPQNRGLTSAEAARLLSVFGENRLPPERRLPWWRRVLLQFQNALVYLLLLALCVDVVTWLHAGGRHFPVEAIAIAAVLLLNASLGLFQEYRSERALEELAKLGSPKAWVFRDGAFAQLDAVRLVPGDLVRLEAGDRVPADGAIVAGASARVDESLLTGESLPIEREIGDTLLSGTLLVLGGVELEITNTGWHSAMGRMAGALARIDTGKTPLERSMDEFGTRIARYVGALSAAIVCAGLVVDGWARLDQVLMFGVAFAVAVVPEGMPAVVTLVLSFGVQRMARRHALVRRLSAVEALGAVTVIASDKTGTLTLNQLTVDALTAPDEDEALRALALANDADQESDAGDPLERGIFEFLRLRGSDAAALRAAHPRVSSRPFDSRWKFMRATVIMPSGELRSYLKGALDVILERSTLSNEARASWEQCAEQQAARGCKVIGLAAGPGDRESSLEFLGFVSLRDPPREHARAAVTSAERAGITVMMLTGDHPATARAIADSVGISAGRALNGAEVEASSDDELATALAEVRVFSRLLPEHKLRIVEILRARGEVVAVTGDGLNDALALKRADVAVAMGKRGSDVAREVSDLVLLDDDFSTIVAAVEEGRIIFENLLSFVRFTFSSNVALSVLVLGGAVGSVFLGLRNEHGALLLPLSALQILWINFMGDGPTALALSRDHSALTMHASPRPRNRSLLDALTVRFVLVDGAIKGAIGLLLLLMLPRYGVSLTATATSVFLYEAAAKLLSAYPARKLSSAPDSNLWLHASVVIGVSLAATCVLWPKLRSVLGLSPLTLEELALVAGALAMSWCTGELAALAVRRSLKP
ncbi:MAG: cation-transporting P-type ATPase [Myxococcales bacterium]